MDQIQQFSRQKENNHKNRNSKFKNSKVLQQINKIKLNYSNLKL